MLQKVDEEQTQSHAMASENHADKLSTALKDNECAQVEELIDSGADVNQTDAEGARPLQYAAETSCIRYLTLLLNHSADIRV